MSSKRRADKYLTDQNWDEDEESEEAGKFEAAPVDILKQRTFKKAKRRIAQAGENTSAFKGFEGLAAPKSEASSNGFSLNSSSLFTLPTKNKVSPDEPTNTEKPSDKSKEFLPNKIQKVASSLVKDAKPSVIESQTASKDAQVTETEMAECESKSEDIMFSEFNRHLTALNKCVSKWIAENVAKDPVCDLTPIFEDYQQHYSNIEDKYGCATISQSETLQSVDTDEEEPRKKLFFTKPDIIIPATSTRPTTPPKDPLGITVASSSSSNASPFRGFGVLPQSKPSTSGFAGFQFGSKMVGGSTATSIVRSDAQTTSTEEDEYVPPKPEATVVEEKDAFYSKRCKLFYMKENSYADRGVGHLHLKSVSGKTQLIVRADTSLGNVLLNIVINSAIPIAKQGKNNVMISCVPNPPIDSKNSDKVVPMLIRVKTTEDADELIEILNKKKQDSE